MKLGCGQKMKNSYLFFFVLFLSCQNTPQENEKLPSTLDIMVYNWIKREKHFTEYKSYFNPTITQCWKNWGYRDFRTRLYDTPIKDFYQISFQREVFAYESPFTKVLCFEKDTASKGGKWKLYYQAFYEKRPPNGKSFIVTERGDTFQYITGKERSICFLPADYVQLAVADSFVTDFKAKILDSFFMQKQPYYPEKNIMDAERAARWEIKAFISGYYFFYLSNDSTEDKLIFPYLYRACQAAGVKDTALMRTLSQYN